MSMLADVGVGGDVVLGEVVVDVVAVAAWSVTDSSCRAIETPMLNPPRNCDRAVFAFTIVPAS